MGKGKPWNGRRNPVAKELRNKTFREKKIKTYEERREEKFRLWEDFSTEDDLQRD